MKSIGVSATFRLCGGGWGGGLSEFSRLLPAALPPHCRQPPSFQPDPDQWHGFYMTGVTAAAAKVAGCSGPRLSAV